MGTIYKIVTKIDEKPKAGDPVESHERTRLVEAKNGAKALAFVTKDQTTVMRATSQDLIDGTKAGIEVETAPEDPPK